MNKYPGLSNDEVRKFVNAVDMQLRRDFSPIWGRWGVPFFSGTDQGLHPKTWKLYLWPDIRTAADGGANGSHELSKDNLYTPVGHVFIEACRRNKEVWTEVASHEILEMLADEWLNLDVTRKLVGGGFELWPREICDPVQGQAYEILGVRLSNFVYPEYYIEGADGPFDHMRLLKSPFEICKTGYSSILKISSGGLAQRRDVYGPVYPDWRRASRAFSRRESRFKGILE